MRKTNYALMMFAALTTASCIDFDNGLTEAQIRYNENFIDQFGNIDPNQDWNMAQQVTANIYMPEIKGKSKVMALTGMPSDPSTRMLMCKDIEDGVASFKFDAVKGSDVVMVIEQNKEYKLCKRYKIEAGRVCVGMSPIATRAFGSSCLTTLNDQVTLNDISYSAVIGQLVVYNQTEKTLADWKTWATTNVTAYNNSSPFEDNSIRHFVKPISLNFSSVELRSSDYVTVESNGDITLYYGGRTQYPAWYATKSVDDWKSEATTNISSVAAGTWNGPWENSSIIVNETDVAAGTDGAVYKGLYPQSNWKLRTSGITYKDQTEDRHINLQYLSNVETEAAEPWTRGWGYSLYGPGGFYMEQCNYYGDPNVGNCARELNKYTTHYGSTETERLAKLKKIEEGFSITSTGGVIELPFVYGATDIIDQFGYVIYDEGEDPLTKPHYILMEDGRPVTNIYNGVWNDGAESGFVGTGMSTWMSGLTYHIEHKNDAESCYCNQGTGIWSQKHGTGEHLSGCTEGNCICERGTGVYSSTSAGHVCKFHSPYQEYLSQYNQQAIGTKYRLVYFDNEGHGTYDIPAGKKIVFFICPVNTLEGLHNRTGYNAGDFNYSLPELNKRIKHYYYNTGSATYEEGNSIEGNSKLRGAVKATAWESNGMTFLGFEDGGRDEDLNDIVFWVQGQFETKTIVKREVIKWHMNYYGVHDTSDTDLYSHYDLDEGAHYNEPTGEPQNGSRTFLGWSTTPDNSSNDLSKTISATVPAGGKCYYAIWDPSTTPIPTQSWLLACEHLGSTFDYDFNDAVVSVKHVTVESFVNLPYFDASWQKQNTSNSTVSLKNYLEIVPYAAGAVRKSHLFYNGHDLGEMHSLLQSSNAAAFSSQTSGSMPMLNTESFGGAGMPILIIKVDDDFTMSSDMGGFTIKVIPMGENDDPGYSTTLEAEEITAPKTGEIPQMLVLPETWKWPKERKNIKDAYPGFKDWTGNSRYTEWLNNKNDELLINR